MPNDQQELYCDVMLYLGLRHVFEINKYSYTPQISSARIRKGCVQHLQSVNEAMDSCKHFIFPKAFFLSQAVYMLFMLCNNDFFSFGYTASTVITAFWIHCMCLHTKTQGPYVHAFMQTCSNMKADSRMSACSRFSANR